MPTFHFEARDERGVDIVGTVVERDEAAGLARLRSSQPGVRVLSMRPVGLPRALERGVAREELARMLRQLGLAVTAGLDLARGTAVLAGSGFSPRLTRVLVQLEEDLYAGAHFSLALARHPELFNPQVVAMAAMGEKSGNLSRVLDRAGLMLEKEADRVHRLRAALTYPALLMLGAIAMVAALLVFFLPKMALALRSFHGDPPLITRLLLTAGDMAGSPVWIALVVETVVFICGMAWLWLRSEAGRAWRDTALLSVPVVARVVNAIGMSRLADSLGLMIRSGIPIDQALQHAQGAVGNRRLARIIADARQYILNGTTLAQALRAQPGFDVGFASMVEIGESSGRMERILEQLQQMYDDQLELTLETAASLIEPLVLAFMGLVVGAAVIAFILPMAQMVQTL